MYRAFLILLSLSVVSLAQVNAPKIGFVRFVDTTLRPVTGVAASFIVGQPLLQAVDSASFGSAGGILSSSGKLELEDQNAQAVAQDAAEPGAIVGIGDSLDTAIAWLPVSGTLARYDGAKFIRTVLPAALPGKVVAIRMKGQNAELLVESDTSISAVTVSLADGNLLEQRFLSGVKAPAIYAGSSILFLDQHALVLQSASGAQQTIELGAHLDNVQFQSMSESWIHISDSQSDWALELPGKSMRLFELPAGAKR